tara:strand:- start:95 stop:652 length:558 start_codon:yes stop_codon:yes gene_type:complete
MTTFSRLNRGFDILTIKKDFPIFTQVPLEKDSINRELLDTISDYRNKNPESIKTNVNANWRSGWELHKKPEFENFTEWIYNQVNFVFSYHMGRQYEYSIIDMWAIQYASGDFAQIHDHYPFHFSGVYYVDVEDGCSPIVFENSLEVKPENGLFILFPSFLSHEVPTTSKKRTVLSFNIAISKQSQ